MAEYKKQHYVPQTYLNGFAEKRIGKDYSIWYCTKKDKIIKKSVTRNIAYKSYYYSFTDDTGNYDHRIEKSFHKIEGKYNSFVETLMESISTINLTGKAINVKVSHRMLVCSFMFLQMMRCPKNMDWLLLAAERHHEKMRDLGLLHYGEDIPKNTALSSFTYIYNQSLTKLYQYLKQKNFSFEYPVRRKATIITCDNPIIRFNPNGPNGIIHENTQIIFPINKRIFLRIFGKGEKLQFVKQHDLSLIDEVNKEIAANSYNEIFGPDPDRIKKALSDIGVESEIRGNLA